MAVDVRMRVVTRIRAVVWKVVEGEGKNGTGIRGR